MTPDKQHQTREILLAAAYDLFVQKGYHGTSMRHIANEANLALGGIYNHFGSKEEIFLAVVAAYHPLLRILPDLPQIEATNFADLVRQIAQRFHHAFTDHPHLINLVFVEMIELQGQHFAPMLQKLQPEMEQVMALLSAYSDEIKPVSPIFLLQSLVNVLLASELTGTILSHAHTPYRPGDTVDDMIDIYLHGILAE